MSKLGRQRNSGGDLDALLRSSSHAIMLRVVVHTLLCVAALVLGFSISREAVLIVVSFRLPHGSLFVKTSTSPHGHEVAIISFPHMKQSRTFSESKVSVSHLTEQAETSIAHPKELSMPMLGTNPHVQGERLAFTESKIMLHHTKAHVPSFQSPHATMAPPTISSKSSRVPVGRHEILIRAWPHPNPLQTVVAHHLIRLLQEEQRHDLGLKERKQLLVISTTYVDMFQSARLTSLIHTLRLVPGPLIWIVVEAGNISNATAAVLASSGLSFRHFSLQEVTPESSHLNARLRTEGLRFIHEHRLEGVVVFADDTTTYNLNFFDEVRKVDWLGAFSIGALTCSETQGHACIDMQNGLESLVSEGNNQSSSPMSLQSPCDSSTPDVYWYPLMRNESNQGMPSMGSLDWSDFAFNARMLWQNPDVPWIKSWNEVVGGNQTFLQSPLDLVSNITHMESLGKCGYFR